MTNNQSGNNSSNKEEEYFKLVILISFIYRMLSSNKSSWKQLLDKMIEHIDIVDPITNPGVLDYLMTLLMNSNDIQIFDLPNLNPKIEDGHVGYVLRVMNEEIMNKKELSKQIRSYFTVGDQTSSTILSSEQSSNNKLRELLSKVNSKKNILIIHSSQY